LIEDDSSLDGLSEYMEILISQDWFNICLFALIFILLGADLIISSNQQHSEKHSHLRWDRYIIRGTMVVLTVIIILRHVLLYV